jgi:threonine dehydratase
VTEPATSLACAGCGWSAPAGSLPFRCPQARPGDDIDHVLRRELDHGRVKFPTSRERNPFVRYRQLLHAYHAALGRGLSDADFITLVQRLDREVVRIDGQGFVITPFTPYDRLGARLGLAPGGLWVKDETGNVSGSHKARHLFGVMVGLAVMEACEVRLKPDPTTDVDATNVGAGFPGPRVGAGSRTSLAIASCGNAALAAAVVARGAGRELDVFVPTWADERVIARLGALGACLTTCPRDPHVAGDPCYHRFHDAVARGAIPFCCQGPDNGLTIEGGSTIAWEMIDAIGERAIDRLFVQVGGGALASACAQGFADAGKLGRIRRLPRLHAVQTEGGFPLKRAYDRVLARVVRRLSAELTFGPPYEKAADLVLAHADSPIIREELHYAATHRAEFMWPWETAPSSVATGILDDETYDWLAVVEGMLLSGGYPVVVSEDTLKAANTLALETTGVSVDHTGTAGLAGLMRAIEDEPRMRDETLAVIFTGAKRQ